ncbi:hypothetical protein AB0M44_03465 [Streptosporangium subroseum]|uniref:hypothetical protein n=1 Tax=Streptosporangium subroseum TaxID=106412 RepID=UPI003415A3C2
MDKSAEALVQRVYVARAAMAEAATAHDLHAVSLILDEWEDALLLARRNGVEVPPFRTEPTEMERGEL